MGNDFIENIGASDKIIFELGKFSLLWNAFESELFNQECTIKKIINYNDYTKINNEIYYADLVNELLSYLNLERHEITEEIIKHYLYSQNRQEYQEEIENVLKETLHGKDLQVGVLLILLRLRNNMFHGIKDCYNINKQLNLFKKANALLNYIILNY